MVQGAAATGDLFLELCNAADTPTASSLQYTPLWLRLLMQLEAAKREASAREERATEALAEREAVAAGEKYALEQQLQEAQAKVRGEGRT